MTQNKLQALVDRIPDTKPAEPPGGWKELLGQGDDPHGYFDKLADWLEERGWNVTGDRTLSFLAQLTELGNPEMRDATNGYTDRLARIIWIRPELPPEGRVGVLLHEAAHVLEPEVGGPFTEIASEVLAEGASALVMEELFGRSQGSPEYFAIKGFGRTLPKGFILEGSDYIMRAAHKLMGVLSPEQAVAA